MRWSAPYSRRRSRATARDTLGSSSTVTIAGRSLWSVGSAITISPRAAGTPDPRRVPVVSRCRRPPDAQPLREDPAHRQRRFGVAAPVAVRPADAHAHHVGLPAHDQLRRTVPVLGLLARRRELVRRAGVHPARAAGPLRKVEGCGVVLRGDGDEPLRMPRHACCRTAGCFRRRCSVATLPRGGGRHVVTEQADDLDAGTMSQPAGSRGTAEEPELAAAAGRHQHEQRASRPPSCRGFCPSAAQSDEPERMEDSAHASTDSRRRRDRRQRLLRVPRRRREVAVDTPYGAPSRRVAVGERRGHVGGVPAAARQGPRATRRT